MKNDDSHVFFPHPRPYYPWLILSISLIFQYYKQLLLISPSVMIPQLAQKYQLDADKLGLLVGMAMYSFFIFQIPIGIFIDKWGIRRITSLGILISALGIILFGYAPTEVYAYIGRFLIGIGTSVALINIVKILANWFQPKMFALLFGVAVSLGSLGDITGIYLTEALVRAVGAPIAMLNYGLIGIIFALIFFLLVKDDAPGAQYDINPKVQNLKLSSTIKRMLKRKQSWVLALFSGFAQTPFPVFLGLWGIPFLMSKYHFSENQGIALHISFLIGLMISAPLMGYLSSLVKRRKIFIVTGSFVSTVLSISIINYAAPTFNLYMIILLFQGFFFGALPLSVAVMREQNVSKISGTAFAFINSTYAIFAAIGVQVTGFLFNFQWNNALFKGVVNATSSSFFSILLRVPMWLGLAFIFSLFIKETYAKQKIKEDLSSE